MKQALIFIAGGVIGFLIGVWWQPFTTSPTGTFVDSSTSTEAESAVTSTSSSASSTDAESVVVSDTAVSITAEQRALLEQFGIDPNSVTITAAMVTCAKDTLGEARLNEITSGATPTFFESMKLLGCYEL